MAADTKDDLLRITRSEFSKLTRVLDTIDGETALQPDPDGICIKDVVGHRAHWIELFFGWVSGGRAGEPVQTPAPGYKWNQLQEYNALTREQQSDLSWVDAREYLVDQHEALSAFIGGQPEDDLFEKHLYPWMNDWTLARWAEASGPSHYRSATKFIRKTLKERQSMKAG